MRADSNLGRILRNSGFAVTAEFVPPASLDREAIEKNVSVFKDVVDAVNVADNRQARASVASWAVSKVLLDNGIEPIMTLVTRDRNRIALQSDLMGASILGIGNIFCTTGDHQKFGDHPGALNVFDIDSVQLIGISRNLGDNGKLAGGSACEGASPFCIGAAANPFGDPVDLMVIRLAQKIEAGADFIQTQPVFNKQKFEAWMAAARNEGLTEKCFMLATVMLLRSAEAARSLKGRPGGCDIPDDIINRLQSLPEKEQAEEGLKICVEQIQALIEVRGVKGVHIIAHGSEASIPEIVSRAGLQDRRRRE